MCAGCWEQTHSTLPHVPNQHQVRWRLSVWPPFPSNRHHRSNGDCLEGNRENYQVCSVQYCVHQLCTVQCTHMNAPNSSLDWVLSHWPHFTVLRFIFVCVLLYIACMCRFVTWWDWSLSLGLLLPSVLWHCRLVIWPVKTVPSMSYNVFSGTLNPTQSICLYTRNHCWWNAVTHILWWHCSHCYHGSM